MTPAERSRANVAKGADFQRWVASRVASALGLSFTETWTARSGIGGECDVQLSTRAERLFPFWVEAKDRGKLAILSWLRQAALIIYLRRFQCS